MKVKRIVVEPGKDRTWRFRGVHETGEALYEGYASAGEAAEAAIAWLGLSLYQQAPLLSRAVDR